jgi:hypothetical protein
MQQLEKMLEMINLACLFFKLVQSNIVTIATGDYLALRIWLIQIEMCISVKHIQSLEVLE